MSRVVLSLLLVVAVGACSDDGGDDDATSTTSAVTTPSTGEGEEPLPPPPDPTGTGLVCAPAGESAGEVDAVLGVTLTEFTVRLDAEFVDAGLVFIQVVNAGDHPHELKIAATDRPEDLPTLTDGRVDEDALGDALVGAIDLFANGDSCEGTFALEPGPYVLFDNATSERPDGTVVSHFAEGMAATVTVA